MLKILAPTDFSIPSKAGLRFALQISSCQKAEILFVHFFHTFRLPEWTDADFRRQVEKDKSYYSKKLSRMIASLYTKTKIKPGKYSCLAEYGLSADIAIMDYCREHPGIDYICIATHGAGFSKQLLGTHTGNLTIRSLVPVIAIPAKYRIHPIKTILYATDLFHFETEIQKVLSFARPLSAKIKVLHLYNSTESPPTQKAMMDMKKKVKYELDFLIRETRATQSILEALQEQITYVKPSLIVMFTNQHRNFIQKIIFPSKAERLSFITTIPLLSINK
jgi:hypothetical protein